MDPGEKVFGLENFGNTCYCNSVLQALYHTTPFREYVLSLAPVRRPPRRRTEGKTPHYTVAHREKEKGRLQHVRPHTSKRHAGYSPMVGFLEDPIDGNAVNIDEVSSGSDNDTLIEMRKRKAILRGPVVNVDHGFHSSYGREESLATALKDLFESIGEHESQYGVASPSRLVEVLKTENDMFRSSMHQDAQEFLNFLLNRLVEEEEKSGEQVPVKASEIFRGELTNEMRCLFCETVTRRHEAVYDISLDTVPNVSVKNCLRKFSSYEVLGGANKFFCDVCGSHQEALKCMKLRTAPKMLILHLKRFKFNESQQENTKLLHRVLYSRYLRLPVTADDCPTPEKIYELTSVIVHLGGGPKIGHYVVVSRTKNGWMLFDDEIVDKVDESFVFKFFGGADSMATVYLLFYQEVSEQRHEQNNVEQMPHAHPGALSALLQTM